MSASREGFDLFRKIGRHHFFGRGLLGDKWARRYVVLDTLGHHICALLGHPKGSSKTRYVTDEGEVVCKRCNRVLAKNYEIPLCDIKGDCR